ncbi:RCC1 domain-containing protein [Cysteiniphilum marinum]|uniref:RCC1 domain-containing protein n=1 Tax=Cysteiniphilum marinum TaxID=2774191 RepID=UPI00193BFADF|nr:hypothetical protein [Cysteiniphilum marinum]
MSKFNYKSIYLVVLATAITACGGGGGSEDPSPTPDPVFGVQPKLAVASSMSESYMSDSNAMLEMQFMVEDVNHLHVKAANQSTHLKILSKEVVKTSLDDSSVAITAVDNSNCVINKEMTMGESCLDTWQASTTKDSDQFEGKIVYNTNIGKAESDIKLTFKSPHDPIFNMDKFNIVDISPMGTGMQSEVTISNATARAINNPEIIFPAAIQAYVKNIQAPIEIESGESVKISFEIEDSQAALDALRLWQEQMVSDPNALIQYKSASFPAQIYEVRPTIYLQELKLATSSVSKFVEEDGMYHAMVSLLNVSGKAMSDISITVTPQTDDIDVDLSMCTLPLDFNKSCLVKVNISPEIARKDATGFSYDISFFGADITHRDPTVLQVNMLNDVALHIGENSTFLANYQNQVELQNSSLLHWLPSSELQDYQVVDANGTVVTTDRVEVSDGIKTPSCTNVAFLAKGQSCYLTFKPNESVENDQLFLKLSGTNHDALPNLSLPNYSNNGVQPSNQLNPEAIVKGKDLIVYYTIAPAVEKVYKSFELLNIPTAVQDTTIGNSCILGKAVSALSPCQLKINIPADMINDKVFTPDLLIKWQDDTNTESKLVVEIKDPASNDDLSKLNELALLEPLKSYVDIDQESMQIILHNNTARVVSGVQLNFNQSWIGELFDLSIVKQLHSIAVGDTYILHLPLQQDKTMADLHQVVKDHAHAIFSNHLNGDTLGDVIDIHTSNSVAKYYPELRVDIMPYIDMPQTTLLQEVLYQLVYTKPSKQHVKITNPTEYSYTLAFNESLPHGIKRVMTGSVNDLANCSEIGQLGAFESCAVIFEANADAAESSGNHAELMLTEINGDVPMTMLEIRFKTNYVYQVNYAISDQLMEIPEAVDYAFYDIKLVNNESDVQWVPSTDLNDYYLANHVEGLEVLPAAEGKNSCTLGNSISPDESCYLQLSVSNTAKAGDYDLLLNEGSSNLAGDAIKAGALSIIEKGKTLINVVDEYQDTQFSGAYLNKRFRLKIIPPSNWLDYTKGENLVYQASFQNAQSMSTQSPPRCTIYKENPTMPCYISLEVIALKPGFDWLGVHINEVGSAIVKPDIINPQLTINFLDDSWAYVSAGGNHTCAVTKSGYTYCWGRNNHGQLGNGTTINSDRPQKPVVVNPNNQVVKFKRVEAGRYHSCGITNQGDLYCWGDNTNKETYIDAATSYLSYGRYVTGISSNDTREIIDLSLGNGVSCLVRDFNVPSTKSNVYCWGKNDKAQLGRFPVGSTGLAYSENAPIVSQYSFLDIDVGSDHACGIQNGDSYPVRCWGANKFGQLGTGVKNDIGPMEFKTVYAKPQPNVLRPIAKVSAGYGQSCATRSDLASNIYCWGVNIFGQLGNGLSGFDKHETEAVVASLNTMEAKPDSIQTGSEYSCAVVRHRGDVYYNKVACWGSAGFGQMGRADTNTKRLVPTIVMDFSDKLRDITQLALGQHHTCVLGQSQTDTNTNRLFCTGDNDYGQVAGTQSIVTTPVEILTPR